VPALFSEHQAKDFCAAELTPICSWRSARLSRESWSVTFLLSRITTTTFYSIYEYLTARFGVPTKNAASAVFLFTRLLASGTRLYAAAIALALAYEMIRGVQPGQKERFFIYIGSTVTMSF